MLFMIQMSQRIFTFTVFILLSVALNRIFACGMPGAPIYLNISEYRGTLKYPNIENYISKHYRHIPRRHKQGFKVKVNYSNRFRHVVTGFIPPGKKYGDLTKVTLFVEDTISIESPKKPAITTKYRIGIRAVAAYRFKQGQLPSFRLTVSSGHFKSRYIIVKETYRQNKLFEVALSNIAKVKSTNWRCGGENIYKSETI